LEDILDILKCSIYEEKFILWKEVTVNNNRSLQIYGYSQAVCIDLVREIEKLNDNEESRIICDEKTFAWIFNTNHIFKVHRTLKLGIHDVVVNEKMLNRYKKYFELDDKYAIVLICSSEFGTVGIIHL
jgi:hypothetical protein